ncbi:MAG: clan AA aspartic protease [Candidatus Accumulibacter sp.]|jgi:clan AA aspartic protease|nr:clan AA aspartic protease [Accumulibacter sp.]
MGPTYAQIKLENPFIRREVEVSALVDSGSVFLIVPEHLALQLGFDTTEVWRREVVLANAQRASVPMIGPIRVWFGDRCCDTSALVLGDEPLLGAVPMEMMDLVVHPATRKLSVNPASPYVPVAVTK